MRNWLRRQVCRLVGHAERVRPPETPSGFGKVVCRRCDLLLDLWVADPAAVMKGYHARPVGP